MWIIVNIHIHHLWLSQTCGFLKSRQVGRRCQLQSPGRVRRRYEEHFPSTPRTTNWNEWSQIHCLVDLPKTSRDSRCGQIFHQLPADIRRWFKMDAWGWKDWKQVGWPVLQIEGEHLPPEKKNKNTNYRSSQLPRHMETRIPKTQMTKNSRTPTQKSVFKVSATAPMTIQSSRSSCWRSFNNSCLKRRVLVELLRNDFQRIF